MVSLDKFLNLPFCWRNFKGLGYISACKSSPKDDDEENKNDVQDDVNVRDDDDQAADEKQIDDEDRLIVEVESEEAVNYDNSSSNEVINFNDEFNESIR